MKRFIYSDLIKHLPKKQVTLLVGARQVGKTTLLKQVNDHLKASGKPSFFLSLENRQTLQLLNESPQNLFQLIPAPMDGARMTLLIDEIQYLDDPSNFLKFHYDVSGEQLKFVVTGSSHFYIDRKFKDSMAGRKRIFELPSLGLDEVLHFRGRDDLVPYVGSGQIPLLYKDEIMQHFYDYLVYGGYPDVVLATDLSERREILKELRNSYAKKDVQEAGLQHPDLYLRLMKITADQISSLFNVNALASELSADNKTLKNYLWVMQKSFHVHCVSPFHKRVASELRKMPKVFFADLGLRNSLLNNFSPIGAREDRGELLENYVYLRLKQAAEEERVKYWRTQNKQEVDFVVQHDDGMAAAFEVKWNEKSFRDSKFAYFRKTYPEIPLQCISLANAFEADFSAGGIAE
ncbi:ATP-binding protein [Pontiellaceae bacterium B1224]|nr:ATP-binding protein [Pontiellaceae bacterium B1224]